MITCKICERCKGTGNCERVYAGNEHSCHDCDGAGYLTVKEAQ